MPRPTAPSHPSAEEILWDIEELHLDEAEFLFEVWEAALEAPNYTLAEVAAGPEQRLLAHVSALVVGGPVVVERLLLPAIENPNAYPERVAAATLAAWESASVAEQDRVIATLNTGEDDQRAGIVRALELVDDPDLDARLINAIGGVRGAGTAAALEILARRRARTGEWLLHFLHSDDPKVARAAARLARSCPDPRVLDGLRPLAQAEDAGVRQAAIESALCRQVPGAWELAMYWAFVTGESPFRRDALTWVALLGDAAAHQRLLGLVDSEELRADAIWALGFTGRVAAVDRCVELLADEEVGRIAGEVVCAIAGLSTEEERFWVEDAGDADGLPVLGDDELDADLVPEAEEALPVPDADAIAQWWAGCRERFDGGRRYLGGEVMTGAGLVAGLRSAPMRRRHLLALELELRTKGEVVVGTRRVSKLQKEQIKSLTSEPEFDVQRGSRA